MKHRWGLRSGQGDYSDSEFSPNSEVYGKGNIKRSQILDDARVFSSNITSSEVSGEAVVANSRVAFSKVRQHAVVEGARVWNSYITESVRVMGGALVKHVAAYGFAQVCGTAVVTTPSQTQDLVIGDFDYFDRGLWTRRPLTFVSKNGFVITENAGQLVTVSCTTNTFKKWYKAGKKYGQILGIPPEEMDEIETYVHKIEEFKMSKDYDRKNELGDTRYGA